MDIVDLLDRYLHAVKFWLPKTQKNDIIAELSEDIRSQIDEKEAAQGRKLSEPEIEAILKQLGRPIVVANRYLPQQYLIGPLLFPIYKFVLKIVALCYLIPWVVVGIVLRALGDGHRPLADVLSSVWGSFWLAASFAFAAVTIIFAVLERSNAKTGLLEDWDPRKLPAVRDPNRIARASSITELVANVVFCTWWISARTPVIGIEFSGIPASISLAPVWQYFFWGFLLLGFVNIATAAINLLKPYWSRTRATIRLLTDIAGASLFAWMCKAEVLAGIAIPHINPEKMLKLANAWMSRSFPIVVIIGVVVAAFDIHRIMRAGEPSLHLSSQLPTQVT